MIIVVRLTANAAEQFPCKRIPLIWCLPVRCMSCRNSLCQLPCLFIHDCRKAVFYQIFRQFSVVSDLLMCDRICNESYLGVGRETVLAWIAKRNMPAYKVGRLWKFKLSEVDEWIRSGGAADDRADEKSDEDNE